MKYANDSKVTTIIVTSTTRYLASFGASASEDSVNVGGGVAARGTVNWACTTLIATQLIVLPTAPARLWDGTLAVYYGHFYGH